MAFQAEHQAHLMLPIQLAVFDTMPKAMPGSGENKDVDASQGVADMKQIQEINAFAAVC
jgi:hypothetical protein